MMSDRFSARLSVLRRLGYAASAACLLIALPASAQSVSSGQLGAAQSFDRGPLSASSGGLDANLWQGLSAGRAASQIEAVNITELSELPYRYMRRILLSAGVPPHLAILTELVRNLTARLIIAPPPFGCRCVLSAT